MGDAVERLIDFWKLVDESGSDWIHPADREVLVQPRWSGTVLWDAPADQATVVAEHRRRKSRLQAQLIPQPYAGDIRKADVVFCLLNPGFDPSNYLSERPHTEFRRQKIANLRQDLSGLTYPFLGIDPDLADTGSFGWWWPKFERMAEGLVDDGWDFDQAVVALSKRVCCIEIVPYHSRHGGQIQAKLIDSLPSSRLAIEAVREKAAEGAKVLLFRSHSSWGIEHDGDRIVRVRDCTRSIVVGADTHAGRLVRERMNPDPIVLKPFAEIFRRPGFSLGLWKGGDTTDGVMQMPWFDHSPDAADFIQAAYDGRWILGISWADWMQSDEAVRLRDDFQALSNATLLQVARLLTVLVRSSRFNEGSLALAFETGLLPAILDRIAILAHRPPTPVV